MDDLDYGQDYFRLFGIPKKFEIDTRALDTSYRRLQSIYHPDRVANRDAKERRLALQASSHVNEAYQTLRHPHLRARYMVELDGLQFNDELETTADPEFLIRQMEWREALDDIAESANPLEDLDRLVEQLHTEQNQLYEMFRLAYEAGNLVEAKRRVLQMGFYTRLLTKADQMAEHLDQLHF